MEWLNSMVSEPYYFFHFLTFFSYLPIRVAAAQFLASDVAYLLLRREIQTVLALSVLLAIKIVREETWEAFVADALLFGKLVLLAVAFVMDYHLALWYSMVFLAIYMLSQQPAFKDLGTAIKLTPLQLENFLTEGNTSRFWLIEFRALYSSKCICASRCFSELSNIYSTKNLSFGIVDLGLFPNVAEKFGIFFSGTGQLPTYILFENGTEVNRFPELDYEVKPFQRPVSKILLSQHFELDRLLLEYVKGK